MTPASPIKAGLALPASKNHSVVMKFFTQDVILNSNFPEKIKMRRIKETEIATVLAEAIGQDGFVSHDDISPDYFGQIVREIAKCQKTGVINRS